MPLPENTAKEIEPFLTFKQIADALRVPLFQVRRAAHLGLFPVYRLANKRRFARLSEVVACMERSKKGGA
jgi:hypothetical protein